MVGDDSESEEARSASIESTAELLIRVRSGDADAVTRLVRIYSPLLQRWARGRLPMNARGVSDTQDLVQITLVRVLDHVEGFDARRPGAFLAYLRRSLLNNLRNEIRSASRRPSGHEMEADKIVGPGRSPLEQVIGTRALEAYEEALETLNEEQRAAVILKIEMGCGNQEIARLLGSPSPNAARMVVARALVHLAKVIDKKALH